METAAVRHYPWPQKHGNKDYFDQNNAVFDLNVTQIVKTAYIIVNNVQKFQFLND